MTKVFIFSIVFNVSFRLLSAYQMWDLSSMEGVEIVVEIPDIKPRTTAGRIRSVLLQLLDMEIFSIVYLTYTARLTGSLAPQRSLELFVAVFEAAPEVEDFLFVLILTMKYALFLNL